MIKNKSRDWKHFSIDKMTYMTISVLKEMLIKEICQDLGRQRWSLLKAGQRSGKNVIATEVAQRTGYSHISLFSGHSHTSGLFEDMKSAVQDKFFTTFYNNRIPDASETIAPILCILDEAMWTTGSYNKYTSLLSDSRCRILIISSRGPEFDNDIRWQMLPGRSFSTWDLNESIELNRLEPELKQAGINIFLRDFGAY